MMPTTETSLEAIQDHLGRYAFASEFVKEKVVLDVACGSGYGSAYLFDKGAGINRSILASPESTGHIH